MKLIEISESKCVIILKVSFIYSIIKFILLYIILKKTKEA